MKLGDLIHSHLRINLEMPEYKQPCLLNPVRYFVNIFSFFQNFCFLSNDRRMNVKLILASKITLSRSGPIAGDNVYCSVNLLGFFFLRLHAEYVYSYR